MLDGRAAAALSGLLSELEAKADAQVAVVTVKDLGGSDPESYAAGLYEKWGIGNKATDRGALILVSVDDRRARIETGYGLEGVLPDGLAGEILDKHMVPFFRKGDYTGGVLRGASAVASIVARDRGVELTGGVPAGRQSKRGGWLSNLLFIALLLVLAPVIIRNPFLLLLLLSGGRGGRGGFGDGGFGGGFGGFGGGGSGGGGAGRGW